MQFMPWRTWMTTVGRQDSSLPPRWGQHHHQHCYHHHQECVGYNEPWRHPFTERVNCPWDAGNIIKHHWWWWWFFIFYINVKDENDNDDDYKEEDDDDNLLFSLIFHPPLCCGFSHQTTNKTQLHPASDWFPFISNHRRRKKLFVIDENTLTPHFGSFFETPHITKPSTSDDGNENIFIKKYKIYGIILGEKGSTIWTCVENLLPPFGRCQKFHNVFFLGRLP